MNGSICVMTGSSLCGNRAMQKRRAARRNCIEPPPGGSLRWLASRVTGLQGHFARERSWKMKKVLFGAFAALLVAAAPARAQDDRPVYVNLGGGFTVPVSDVSERFSTGGSFNFGILLEPPSTPAFGFQVEYGYNRLGGEDKFIPLFPTPTAIATGEALIESHHSMHYVDFNAILKTPRTNAVAPYAIGGFGMYYRSVSLTTPDVGYTTWCDPYW